MKIKTKDGDERERDQERESSARESRRVSAALLTLLTALLLLREREN